MKEALEEEFGAPIHRMGRMRLMFFPEVSGKEMRDITGRHEKPGRKPAHIEKMDV